MSKFKFSKLRLKEIYGVGYRSTRDPKAISAYERYVTSNWVVQCKGWFGWGVIGDEYGRTYHEAKKALEAIEADEVERARYLDELAEAQKTPTKILYPPLPDEEPK